jgi:hypothetical protein
VLINEEDAAAVLNALRRRRAACESMPEYRIQGSHSLALDEVIAELEEYGPTCSKSPKGLACHFRFYAPVCRESRPYLNEGGVKWRVRWTGSRVS